jgi:peptidoglycan/xylan/chitin deacetylase (PgdA/CDA1 family)
MFVERASYVFRHFMRASWNMGGSDKTVYLTFDDGPHPEITMKVLNILDIHHVKATFFCIGKNVKKYPEVFAKILKCGHSVGNHTMSHIKGFSSSFEDYVNDVNEANLYIKSNYFRPPYGRITPKQLKELKKTYKIIMWDVITRDYNPNLKSEKMLRIIKHFTKRGSIIVFHDSLKASENMLESLPKSIEWLQAKGFEFKTFN